MPSTKAIKQRIKSVKNTAQITRAMEAVSATKMRKSQEFALRARPYAVAGFEMLKNLLARTAVLPEILKVRAVKNSCLLVITSDKGLAGAFNSNALRKAESWINFKKTDGQSYSLITVGKKAKDYFSRRGIQIYKSFSGFGDFILLQDTLPVADEILNGFLNRNWDETWAVYTHFRTTLKQETVLRKILPAQVESIREIVSGILPERGRYAPQQPTTENLQLTAYRYEYKFEPSSAEILDALIPQLLRMSIHHLILESNASEHSARMVAMKNASESAGELIDKLSLVYNKARQAGITRELTEITAGSEALK